MRPLILLAAFVLLSGCGAATPPPIAPDPEPPAATPLLLTREPGERPDQIPRSVRRLLAEEKQDLAECEGLVGGLGDNLGRRRAGAETASVAQELARLESAIDTWNGDSDRLDSIVQELQLSATRVGLLREKLRTAAR